MVDKGIDVYLRKAECILGVLPEFVISGFALYFFVVFLVSCFEGPVIAFVNTIGTFCDALKTKTNTHLG